MEFNSLDNDSGCGDWRGDSGCWVLRNAAIGTGVSCGRMIGDAEIGVKAVR